ncbi:metallo-beta-lactamase domain-containing protein 2 isoform X1 [Megalobrama amblycephala]|uniref:metallo-beta-lactamase domain-containing protein 2 n=1 Tax=Ctenopharyngodon idella TaxID=7959 RepID=UPI00201439EF|nr:metallo-beta-lactamase domain-containing protein 2 isoform X1 [Megalobrama amblycephala]XP_051750701.1 metallo-beta-lactamase domain-containing protein 2 [Ctenopharyngodon idella]
MSATDWYAHKSLENGVFWIQERFYESGNRANIWLIRGSHQDVVIDTGLGLRSLPEYIHSKGLLGDDSKRKNPLLAIGTHVHFDHSGGLHQFQQVGVHKAEVDALANGDNFETVTWLSDREIVEDPAPGWRARQYRVKAVTPTHILQEGDVINLGDRQLTVLHMPGHSRGSICLHDKENKMLFSGDVVYDGSMIDWLPYSRISDYIRSCERLVEMVDKEEIDLVMPGHYNTFGSKRLHRLASNYMASAGACHRASTCVVKSIASLALRASNSRSAC